MKYIVLAIAAFLILIAVGVQQARKASSPAGVAASAHGNWIHDMPSALEKAKGSNKPILVDFYATWCPPCKMMDRQTFPNADVVAELENWVPVKIDVDRNQAIAQQFGIRAMPTMVLLDADGKEITRFEGYMGPSELIALARKARG